MSIEGKETTTSDAALNEAAKKAEEQGQSKEDSVSKEEKEWEKAIQRESTARGREVKAIKDTLDAFKTELLEKLTPPKQSQEEEYVTTAEDVKRILKRQKEEEDRAFKSYNSDYLKSLNKLVADEGLDDDGVAELEKLIQTSFKDSATDFTNARLDAEINFNKAMRIIEKKNTGKAGPNLKHDDPTGAGPGGPQKVQSKGLEMPKLDEHAATFVNWVKSKDDKWTDEKVAETLKGETPMRLRK